MQFVAACQRAKLSARFLTTVVTIRSLVQMPQNSQFLCLVSRPEDKVSDGGCPLHLSQWERARLTPFLWTVDIITADLSYSSCNLYLFSKFVSPAYSRITCWTFRFWNAASAPFLLTAAERPFQLRSPPQASFGASVQPTMSGGTRAH